MMKRRKKRMDRKQRRLCTIGRDICILRTLERKTGVIRQSCVLAIHWRETDTHKFIIAARCGDIADVESLSLASM